MTNKGNILLVDDDKYFCSLVREIMAGNGYCVEAVNSGELALAAASASAPDLILLDIMMPGLDGFEIVRQLKAAPGSRELPVIFLSAVSDIPGRIKGLRLGAVDFISKPFEKEELLAKVRAHCELSRLRKKLERQTLELANERDRLAALLNSISDEVWFCDRQKKFTLVNPGAVQNDYTPPGAGSEAGHLSHGAEVLRPDGTPRPVSETPLLISLAGRPVDKQEEMVRLGQNGPLRYRQVSSAPVRSKTGEIIGSVAVVRDISEMKRVATALKASEAKYRNIVENLNDLAFMLDRQGLIVSISPQLFSLTGYKPEELLGRPFTEFICPEDIPELQHSFLEVMQGKLESREFRYRCKDGSVKWARSSSLPVSENGQVSGVSGVFSDITERKKAEEALRESEERYRAVAEYSNNAICILDPRGRFQWVNDRMLSMGGYSRKEYMAAESFVKFIAPESVEFVAGNFYKFAAGRPYEHRCTLSFIRADGQKRVCNTFITDYKDKHGSLNLVISMLDVTEQKTAEEALRESEDKFKYIFDNSVFGKSLTLPSGEVQVNRSLAVMLGYTQKELSSLKWQDLTHPEDIELTQREIDGLLSGEKDVSRFTKRFIHKNGTIVWGDVGSSVRRDSHGKALYLMTTISDITVQHRLELQLRQSQKMETVGILAGGVAHDFNNILTAIKCYAEFIKNGLPAADPKVADAEEILSSSERAIALTRQLLAFSRRQIMAPRVVDINGVLGNMVGMLRRIIGENNRLETKIFPAPCLALVDPGQIEQVILNLVVNARDAMRPVEAGSGAGESAGQYAGNVITLETEITNPPEEFFDTRPDLAKGPLVCLKVRDNGTGMSEEVKSRIFEPFFTTKEQGRGTGLGLSMVYGIVKQSQGDIEVESVLGQGSVFYLYLPFVDACPTSAAPAVKSTAVKGHETILFVEDEDSLRRLGERVLRTGGYTVLGAADGPAALKLMRERGAPVDLLVTDVVMPGMSGKELALALTSQGMVSRTLYMSGYTDDAIVKHGVLEPGIAFMYKPFTIDSVLSKIREVLDGPPAQSRA